MEKISKKYVDSLDGRLSSQSLLIPRRSRTLVWGFEPPPFFPIQSRPPDWLVAARLPRCTPSATCWVRVARVLGAFASRSRRSVRHLCTHHVNQNGCSHHVRGCRPRRRPPAPPSPAGACSPPSQEPSRRTPRGFGKIARWRSPNGGARRARRARSRRAAIAPRSSRENARPAIAAGPRVSRSIVAARSRSRLGVSGSGARPARGIRPKSGGGALAIHSLRPRSRASDLVPPLTSPRPPAIPPSRPRSSTRAVQAAKPSLSARVCVPARPHPRAHPSPPLIVPRPSTASTQQRRVQIFTRRGRDWRLRLKRASAFFIRLADPPSPSALFARTGP